MEPLLARLVDEHPDSVRLVYRHFPLNIHPHAQKSAEASEAAAAQGKFWEFHEGLFTRQHEFANKDLGGARAFYIQLAGELGLDVAQFTQELDDGVYTEYVEQMAQESQNLGLPGTPSAIVDGFPVGTIPFDYEIWERYVIDSEAVAALEANQYDAPPMSIDVDKSYLATVTMASGDSFTIELLPKSAPQTVNSFVFLAEQGFFDGVTFHRVIPGFVAQTGDPSATGRGGPGYTFANEIDPNLSHDKAGMIAMANSGPDTNGSQWYITLLDGAPQLINLDGSYSIFGRIADGMDVVLGISAHDPSDASAEAGDKIESITIEVGG